MKRSSVRAFGIACFLIGAILTITNQYNIPFISSKEDNIQQYKKQIAELEVQLEQANEKLRQAKQTKQNSETVQTKETTADTKNEAKEPQQESPTTEKSDEIITETLYIYSGLTSAEVAQKLKDLGIINNSVEMELFLAQPEYAKSIQKGQFKLNSTMTVEEIANIITGKPQGVND
ncbi:hypothetical protein SAMN05880501_112134 [Ureibacillus xyleni]|uniref:YceG-like family protein n=1 Tax=Ureibacillus xyleni TaxID=614648 RepID=A0A285TG84_9BACL|nr:endolytic transglycosylase MltG [Ureibacillus xyleni]SOC21149.1 hypothetical protein SAMN05880501_112134 [Ureibacillus xyleni]